MAVLNTSYRWDFPSTVDFVGNRPLIFLLLSIHGPDDAAVLNLTRVLTERGYTVFRHDRRVELSDAERLELYRAAVFHPRVARDDVIVFGFNESGDAIARGYYGFTEIQSMRAAIFVSPTVSTFHLNKLTCPFLIVEDPRSEARERTSEAVHHHQMRYGDSTTKIELNPAGFDVAMIEAIGHWLPSVARFKGRTARAA